MRMCGSAYIETRKSTHFLLAYLKHIQVVVMDTSHYFSQDGCKRGERPPRWPSCERADHGGLPRRVLLLILSERSNTDLRPLMVCTISSTVRIHIYKARADGWMNEQDALASLAFSASNSYRLFPPSRETRCTTMRNAAEDVLPVWHETTLLMWYDDVLPLSKTALAPLFVVGMI